MFGRNAKNPMDQHHQIQSTALEACPNHYAAAKMQHPSSSKMDVEKHPRDDDANKLEKYDHFIDIEDFGFKPFASKCMDIEKPVPPAGIHLETDTKNEAIKNKLLDVFSILLSDLGSTRK